MIRIDVSITPEDLRAMCERLRPDVWLVSDVLHLTTDFSPRVEPVRGFVLSGPGYGWPWVSATAAADGRSARVSTGDPTSGSNNYYMAGAVEEALAYHDALVAELTALGEAQRGTT